MRLCLICGGEDTVGHQQDIHPPQVYIKPNCKHRRYDSYRSLTQSRLVCTMYTVLRNEDNTYVCPQCPFTTFRQDDLRSHLTDCHPTDGSSQGASPPRQHSSAGSPSSLKRNIEEWRSGFSSPKRKRLNTDAVASLPRPSSLASVTLLTPNPPFSPDAIQPLLPQPKSSNSPIIPPTFASTQSSRRVRLTDLTLERIGIYVDPLTHIVVCLDCKTAIPAPHVLGHINSSKGSCRKTYTVDAQDLNAALQSHNAFQDLELPLGGLTSPILGLPVQRGWVCTVEGPCKGLVLGSRSMKNVHKKDAHAGYEGSLEAVNVHQVYAQKSLTRYVVIKPSEMQPVASGDTRWLSCKARLEERGRLSVPTDQVVTRMQRTPMECATAWDTALVGCDTADLQLYARPPTDEEEPSYIFLYGIFRHYITTYITPTLEGDNNTMLLRLINSSDK